jgi:hypothetical protein
VPAQAHNTNEPGDTLFQFTFFSDPTYRVLPGDIAGAGEFAPFLSLTPPALELWSFSAGGASGFRWWHDAGG